MMWATRREFRGPLVIWTALCLSALPAGYSQVADVTGSPGYDPLDSRADSAVIHLDMSVHDEARDRDIPVRIWLVPGAMPKPVILFSHGLGGTRKGYAYLGKHWASRGYMAVFLQHPGSDDSVWKSKVPAKRMAAMKQAAGGGNFMLRVRDVPAVLDQLEVWNAMDKHALSGQMDLTRIGMSGHSFGAVTTQAVSGQAFWRRPRFTDGRIRAAIALSPSAPRRGDTKAAFGGVNMPWMLMTGTKDTSPIGAADVASRLSVFPALPKGNKYELVLNDGEHSAFSGRPFPGDGMPRNPNHHRAILSLSTAFWDSYLREDGAALAWLRGDGPRAVLEEKDRWQWK